MVSHVPTNLAVKVRIIVLGLAVGLMGASITAVTLYSQRQARDLRTKLSDVDFESFEIAAHFKDALRDVNNTRLRFSIGHDPAIWAQFLKASRELGVWIDQQAPKLTTQGEKDALQQVKAAYQDYLRRVQEVPPTGLPPVGQSDSLAEFASSRVESQHLFDLGEALARAHQASRDQLLAYSGQRLAQLRLVVLGSLGLLFVFVVALALLAYRDMIAPLRVKLVETQQLAEQREKLASLGILAAGVAHEIRNPLTAIKAALFIQQKRFPPGSKEREDADLVQREILRLEHIVNDFLLFARPTEPNLVTIPADQPLADVQRLFASELAAANIRLLVEAPESLRIQADSGQIKQVLINLVQNAADSIGRDGTITLRARADRRRLAQAEREVVIIEVADTGKGISAEVGRRLFDPFFTTKDNGTGLGLSIAARIVQKHGGALQYQTQVNRGTTFGIVLPGATA